MNENTKIKFHILAIICIIIFCFAITPVTFQNDTYYTISIGKHIVETGKVDMMDPFSWHEDLPYTYPHWAYDVGTYLVYQLGEVTGIGGFCAIYIATILLCMILGVVIYFTSNKLCKNPLISFFVTMAVMYLLKDFITARAQLVTYILFVLTILFIEKFLETKKKRYPVYLVIISILIANLHCAVWPFYFVLYLPYVAEYIIAVIADTNFIYRIQIKFHEHQLKRYLSKQNKVENNFEDEMKNETLHDKTEINQNINPKTTGNTEIIKKINQKIEKEKEKIQKLNEEKETTILKDAQRRSNPYKVILKKEKAAKWLIVIMIICALTGLLTPLRTTPYTYLAKTMEGNTTQNISEHQPLTLINNKPILAVFAVFLAILIFTDIKVSLRDFFMLGGLTLLSFMSRRQTSIFVIICGFIFAKMVTSFLEKYDKRGTKIVMEFMTSILGKILSILIVILISFLMYRDKIDDEFVSTSSYPVEASNYILENLDLQNMKLFNEYNYGSYLLYRGIPVFIDSRADLYAPEFNGTLGEDGKYEGRDIFSDYINVSTISTYYEDKFEQYGITHVITGKNTKLNMFLSRDEHYIELYSDDNFVIYKRMPENS